MQRTRLKQLLAAPVAAATVTFTAGAASPHGGMTDAGESTDTTAQCGRRSFDRTGAWFCVDSTKSRRAMEQHIADRARGFLDPGSSVTVTKFQATSQFATRRTPSTSSDATTASGDGKTGWCNNAGCWYLWQETPYQHSEFDGTDTPSGPYTPAGAGWANV